MTWGNLLAELVLGFVPCPFTGAGQTRLFCQFAGKTGALVMSIVSIQICLKYNLLSGGLWDW
jgi:hypothetical protein